MTTRDIPRILELENLCFPGIPPERRWRPEHLEAHVSRFREGQWVAELEGVVVGSATNLRVPLAQSLLPHTWKGISGAGMLTTHAPGGDALYGTEIMVHPDVRRRGIGRKLYESRKSYVTRNGLRAFVTGGRIPNYESHAKQMSAVEYVARVVSGELVDRVLTPQLRSGMVVLGVLAEYLTDPKSRNFATLLAWFPPRPWAATGTLDEAGRG